MSKRATVSILTNALEPLKDAALGGALALGEAYIAAQAAPTEANQARVRQAQAQLAGFAVHVARLFRSANGDVDEASAPTEPAPAPGAP